MSLNVNGMLSIRIIRSAQVKEQTSTMKSRKNYHYLILFCIRLTIRSFARVTKVGFLFLKQDVSFNYVKKKNRRRQLHVLRQYNKKNI